MAIRKFISIFIFLFCFHFCFIDIQAQETSLQNYYYTREENTVKFIQKLYWQGTDYVSHFVVIVEQFVQDRSNRQGAYTEVFRKRTEEYFTEVSLSAGRYRYRVEVYDVFEELFHVTEWRDFEVIRALQPQVSSFTPGGFYLDEDDTWVLTVRGRNLLPESVYYLIRGNIRINPESFSADGNSCRLTFSENSLIPGRYEIYVRNPGGLDTLAATFTIGYRKPLDFNIALMYSPIIPVTGFLFKNAEELEAPFLDSFYPLNAGARINFFPFKRHWGYLGAELTGSFGLLDYEREYYSVSGYLIHTHISFLYQKYFMKKRFSLNAGIGMGISMLTNIVYEYPSGPPTDGFSGVYPSGIGSLYFSYFVKRNIFINAGADFIYMITDSGDGDFPGVFRPFVGAGMQF